MKEIETPITPPDPPAASAEPTTGGTARVAPANASGMGGTARVAPAIVRRGMETPARVTLFLMVLGVAAGISILAIFRYRAMQSDWAFDLAFFHDLVFNASAGHGFTQSASTHELDGLLNLSHAFFLLPLLVPFYWLVPKLETLLVIQALALACGAWPVARLARSAGSSPLVATLAAGFYLASFPLWRLGLCDFRPLLLCIPALLWLMAGFATRKRPVGHYPRPVHGRRGFQPRASAWKALLPFGGRMEGRGRPVILVATLVACLAREEVPLLVAAVAILFLVRGRGIRRLVPQPSGDSREEAPTSREANQQGAPESLDGKGRMVPSSDGGVRRAALLSLGLALLYFLLQMWIRPQSGFYIAFDRPAGLLEAFHWAPPEGFSRTQQLRHVLAFFPPGMWTGLLEPWLIVGSLPLLVYQFFISNYEWWGWQGPYVHHMAPLLAFSAAAGARGWGKLQAFVATRFPRGAFLLVAIMAGLLAFQIPQTVERIRWTMGLLDGQSEIAQRQQQVLEVNEILKQVPPDAKIATDYRLIARLSGRRWLYAYPSNFRPPDEDSASTFLPSTDAQVAAAFAGDAQSADPGVNGSWAGGDARPYRRMDGTRVEAEDSTEPSSSPRTPGLEDVDWMLVNLEHEFWISILDKAPDWRKVEEGGGYRLYRRVGAY